MANLLPENKLPARAILAFALTLVNTKPQELTFQAKGRRHDALSSRHFHLDRSSWWRSEYEREKGLRLATEDENRGLKLKIDELKQSAESARPNGPARKRKKVDEDVVPVPRSPKKAKRDPPLAKWHTEATKEIAEFDFTGIGEMGSILMRSFYEVNSILKSNQKTDSRFLAYECVQAASTVPQVVQQTVEKFYSDFNSETDELKSVLTATSRAILSLVMGLNRLSHVADGAQNQGQVTYAFAKMYSKLADILSQTSKSEVAKVTQPEASIAANKKPQSKGKAKQQPKTVNIKANPILSLLTTFLCNVIDNLDPKIEAHNSLFESFAYVVLNKLGSCLYIFVFGHQRGETMEVEIATTKKEDEIEDAPQLTPEEQTLRAAKLEAPYLLQLLKRVISGAPAHIDALNKAKTGKPKIAKSKGLTKGALAIAAKDKLQKTLVNCVFGMEGVDKDDPLMDCLKMPSISDAVLTMPRVNEADVQAWFQAEVWRLLGWEILARD